ncbi:MAG: type IV conjugative transfer system lipoprotein TraV [Proteobacteria bacterium]|nr:type IV conjugative transfer system lipoprotein TraV [Pseudomonadota bacterium]
MMNQKLLWIVCLTLYVTGCGKVFNPYHSEYMCPDVYKGKCATMDEAYEESFEDNELVLERQDCKDCDKQTQKNKREQPSENKTYTYKDKLFTEIAAIIDEPETPVLVPPKVSRVLIISYTDDDEETFFGYRHVYFITDKPRFTYEPNMEAF